MDRSTRFTAALSLPGDSAGVDAGFAAAVDGFDAGAAGFEASAVCVALVTFVAFAVDGRYFAAGSGAAGFADRAACFAMVALSSLSNAACWRA